MVLTARVQELEALRAVVKQLPQDKAELQQRLAMAVVLAEDKQAAWARVGQARGVTLRDCWAVLEFLMPGQVLRVPTWGRGTHATGESAGPLLAVLDEPARARVGEAERQARKTLAEAAVAQRELAACDRQGRKRTGPAGRARAAWKQAEPAMGNGQEP